MRLWVLNDVDKGHCMNDVVITGALRTAVGKFNGSLATVAAAELGAQVIKALLARTGVNRTRCPR